MLFLNAIDNDTDRETVIKLYGTYKKLMFIVAKKIVFDPYKAEEMVNDSMIKIINNIHKFPNEPDLICNRTKSLIVTIVRNTCINEYNRTKNRNNVNYEDVVYDLCDSSPLPDELIITKESTGKIAKALGELNERYASVLKLKLIYNFDNKEISELLDISPELVRKRFERGRNMLTESLMKEGIYDVD